jgi:hypothetical protein
MTRIYYRSIGYRGHWLVADFENWYTAMLFLETPGILDDWGNHEGSHHGIESGKLCSTQIACPMMRMNVFPVV